MQEDETILQEDEAFLQEDNSHCLADKAFLHEDETILHEDDKNVIPGYERLVPVLQHFIDDDTISRIKAYGFWYQNVPETVREMATSGIDW